MNKFSEEKCGASAQFARTHQAFNLFPIEKHAHRRSLEHDSFEGHSASTEQVATAVSGRFHDCLDKS
jgi:hypothetical protein